MSKRFTGGKTDTFNQYWYYLISVLFYVQWVAEAVCNISGTQIGFSWFNVEGKELGKGRKKAEKVNGATL